MDERGLRELGVPFSGGMPNVGGYVVNKGQTYRLPAGMLSLISTKALTWRAKFVEKRFLPNMLVSNRLVTATQSGLTGRPTPAIPNHPNLFIAGDWVGQQGLLADAAFASAKEAAELCERYLNK